MKQIKAMMKRINQTVLDSATQSFDSSQLFLGGSARPGKPRRTWKSDPSREGCQVK